MYFARIVFFCDDRLTFKNLSEDRLFLFEAGNAKCTVKQKQQGQRRKVILEYGGFDNEEEARKQGINLLRNVKLQMCKQDIAINISGIKGVLDSKEISVKPAEFTEHGLLIIRNQLLEMGRITPDQIVREEFLGLNIYKVVSDIDEIHFVAQDFEIKYDTDFKLDNIILKSWNEKLDVALSFLNTGSLSNDIRIKFLLKIMAIEVLVSDKQSETDDYVKMIDNIIKSLSTGELFDRVKNDIGRLKIKSIGKKCRELIETVCAEKKYLENDAVAFFNKCYRFRSSLVHSGNMDIDEISKYDYPLKNMVVDIIEGMAEERDKK